MKNKNIMKEKKENKNKKIKISISGIVDGIEKVLQKIFTCKWLYYVLIFLSAYYLYYKGLTKKLANLDGKYMNYYYICCVIIFVIIFALLIVNNKFKKLAIEKKFLIFALVLGFGYLFLSPVFSQSDESFHFIRAYQVSRGHFISPRNANGQTRDDLPVSIYRTLWDDDDRFPEYKNYEDFSKESKIPLNVTETTNGEIRASGYIFLNYIPHAMGIEVGKILKLSPYYLGLLGRLFNMLTCIGIMYIGIKIIPVFKKTFSIFLLTPTIISYVASLSADGLVIAMSFLLIAMVAKYIYEHTKLNWKHYLLLLLVVSFVSTCKVSYLPIIGIIIFLPYECFKNKKTKWIYSLSLIILGIIFSLSWINISSISIVNRGSSTMSGFKKVFDFLYVFINSMYNYALSYTENIFAGNFLYQCRVTPYTFIPIIYLFIVYLACKSEKESLNLRFISKFLIVSIIILISLLVAYALYTANTEAGASLINGLQGRYFIPIMLLIPFLLNKSSQDKNIDGLFDASLVLNMLVFFSMVNIFVH